MIESLFSEFLPSTLVGFTAIGVGIIFYLIEQRSTTTVVLSASYVLMGLALALNPPYANRLGADISLWPRLLAVFEAGAIICFALWLWKVAATAQATSRAQALVRISVWALCALALAYFVLGYLYPHERLNDFIFSISEPGVFRRPGFWMFAGIWILVAEVFLVAWVTLMFQQLDDAERVRATATIIGTPFATLTPVLPLGLAELSLNTALLIWLVGFFRYFVIQGERGVFMSRFLSPQVSQLVRMQGLASVMQPRNQEITAVCCDLRGFTAYAEAHSSQEVIELLGEYYEVVGAVVGEFNGTIKDYAGDGIMILIGAPLEVPEHAQTGLALARRILSVVRQVTDRRGSPGHPLGLGLGVACGPVTVGAIGSSSRMEYTAVGMAVNMAARLCQAAVDGEILIEGQVAQKVLMQGLQPRGLMKFKGITAETPVYLAV